MTVVPGKLSPSITSSKWALQDELSRAHTDAFIEESHNCVNCCVCASSLKGGQSQFITTPVLFTKSRPSLLYDCAQLQQVRCVEVD